MKKYLHLQIVIIVTLVAVSCVKQSNDFKTLRPEVLKDKIAGGWAGKMIGVTYGAPTEFHAMNRMFQDTITWKPNKTWESMWQDDIYVQLTFLMTMDQYGMDAPAKKFQEMFAKSGYPLWHANMQARKNYFDSIFPPASGSPEYSMHADDIDFQIESDYLGFMAPGMPQTAMEKANKMGHIMNYGDGLYGGVFVAALYAEAYFENDIQLLIEKALTAIPSESDYAKIIRDVIMLHQNDTNDWKVSWQELQAKWGEVDICGSGSSFNIDAKLNGAYIVLGLLYGNGEPMKTLEIATRCGQDSDCNPSNAMAVLGVMKGFSGLPKEMQDGVMAASDSVFVNTTYTYNSAVNSTYKYALELITINGGKVDGKIISIKTQKPVAPELEVSYPNLVFDKAISAYDEKQWILKGKWATTENLSWPDKRPIKHSISSNAGDALEILFNGTGISIEGSWVKEGGKAEIYLDGVLNRTIDTYYYYANQEHTTSIWHVLNLKPREHNVRVVVKGEKRPEAMGTKIEITQALIFKTAPKKSDGFKFSFE